MAKDSELKRSDKTAKVSTKTTAPAKTEKKSVIQKIRKYFKDLKAEIKKVVWPTRAQVVNNTMVVLSTMAIAGVFIWGVDTIFTQVLKLLLGIGA